MERVLKQWSAPANVPFAPPKEQIPVPFTKNCAIKHVDTWKIPTLRQQTMH